MTGSADSTAVLWSINGTQLLALKHAGPVESVAFSPDGTKILTGSWDHTARLWDMNGNLLRTFKVDDEIRVRSVAFSPDGKKIFVATSNGIGSMYDIRTVQEFLKSDDSDALTPDLKREFKIK